MDGIGKRELFDAYIVQGSAEGLARFTYEAFLLLDLFCSWCLTNDDDLGGAQRGRDIVLKLSRTGRAPSLKGQELLLL